MKYVGEIIDDSFYDSVYGGSAFPGTDSMGRWSIDGRVWLGVWDIDRRVWHSVWQSVRQSAWWSVGDIIERRVNSKFTNQL